MWDKLKELMRLYAETSRDARTGGITSTIKDIDNLDISDEEKVARKQDFALKHIGANLAGISLGTSVAKLGLIPGIATEAAATGGGYAGYKLGEKADEKFGTKWITPTLSIVGGLGSGIGSYKGLVNAGTKGLLKGNSMMYDKNFVSDVVATSLNKASKVPYKPTYGLVKWYGPTMGKTTAAKTNPNLVDFDDYIRTDLEILASKHGMNKQQLMMSQDPAIREEARQVMLKSIDGWKQNPSNASKTLVVSKSDIIQDPIYNNTPMVLKKEEFLRRNAARGETDINNSLDWYNSTRKKGGDTLLEWPDEQGVYISDIEPYITDPHQITFTPKSPSQGTTSYKFYERPSKLSDAEKLGIPKGERSNPKAIENPQYWGYEQWNERYNAAVKAGNWKEVQRLRDLHFKRNAPNTKVVDKNGMPKHMYHGEEGRNFKGKPYRYTTYEGVNWDLEDLVEKGATQNHWRLSKPNRERMGNYHTPDYRTALGYARRDPTLVHDDYLNITNPFTWDEEAIHQILLKTGHHSEKILDKEPGHFKMRPMKDINGRFIKNQHGGVKFEKGEWIPDKFYFRYPQVSSWTDFAESSKEELMKLGYDGLYIPQYHDSYGAFVSPSQFKSADPITWDGKGEIIPIVKRDNFRNLDTRYQQGGKLNNKLTK